MKSLPSTSPAELTSRASSPELEARVANLEGEVARLREVLTALTRAEAGST
jgi:uncharacterized protein YceH (UPF0502 family)